MDDPPSVDLDPAELLAAPPNEDYALLELELAWTDLDPAQERIAANLRSFVVTRDPLDWIPGRGPAWATANADGDVLELVVYVALDALRDAVADGGNVAAALGRYGEAAVRAGAAAEGVVVSGAQPALATAGRVPRLLDGLDDAGAFGVPTVRVASHGWEPLGLGAIQDLVQDAFGPVDFDRSLVRLDPVEPRVADCAACRGERFGFPGDLETARPLLCSPHRAVALAVTAQRIMRARESNALGWRAIGKASARINGLPEPGGLPLPPRTARSAGRNDPCPCGSGRKYKHCCGA
jgi:SEC-C motif-containing protein